MSLLQFFKKYKIGAITGGLFGFIGTIIFLIAEISYPICLDCIEPPKPSTFTKIANKIGYIPTLPALFIYSTLGTPDGISELFIAFVMNTMLWLFIGIVIQVFIINVIKQFVIKKVKT